jgi:hypothetical protein
MNLFIPPDPDSRMEMWIVLQVVAALGRADAQTFILLLAVIVLYATVRIFLATCEYLFRLYREKGFKPNAHQHLYRIALLIGGGLVLIVVVLCGSPETRRDGLILFPFVFTLFVSASAILNWYTNRQATAPTLPTLTAEEYIRKTKTVQRGKDKGLLA